MARFLKPLVRSGGYYPSRRWTPLVYPGGYTTANGGEEPAPPPIEKTVTGNPIHILDALAKPAQALSVKLEPVQDLHGYDSPWPAGGGKNKFQISSFSLGGASGRTTNIYFDQPIPAGKYTFSYTKAGTATLYGIELFGENGRVGTFSKLNPVTRTLSEPAMRMYAYMDSTEYSDGKTLEITNIQLEVGSSASSYQPYSNICPISGRTSATVTRAGRNLFDKSTGIQFTYNNVLVARSQGFGVPFKFKKGVTYTISCNGTTIPSAIYIIEPYTSTVITQVSANYSISFTPSADTEGGMNFYWSSAHGGRPTDATDIMVEVGSVKHDFEPYAGNTYTIQLGDTVYGGTLDVTTGKLTVDMAMVDMGTLNWMYYSAQRRIVAQVNSGKPAGTNVGLDGACSVYKVVNTAYRQAPDKSIVIGNNFISNSYAAMVVRDENYTDAETFKTAVSGQTLVFPLKNPVTYQLTPTEVRTLLGTNNVWSDANGDLELTYYADGNASTSEALGILLGGRYTPSDDVTDKEALDIILGGTK